MNIFDEVRFVHRHWKGDFGFFVVDYPDKTVLIEVKEANHNNCEVSEKEIRKWKNKSIIYDLPKIIQATRRIIGPSEVINIEINYLDIKGHGIPSEATINETNQKIHRGIPVFDPIMSERIFDLRTQYLQDILRKAKGLYNS